MTDLADLLAREAARDLIARYTWAGDRGRSADLADLFTVDGVLDVGEHGGRWEGRDGIRAELDRISAGGPDAGPHPGHVRHHVSSIHIEVLSPTEIAAGSYFAVHTRIGLDHWGRYRDRIVLDDGRWLFAERGVRVDGASPDSLMVRS